MNGRFCKAIISVISLLVSFSSWSQRGEVKGVVLDTTSYPRIANASATIIGSSDSVLLAFARTRKDGTFLIPNIPYGNYILIVSHPSFGDYAEEITLSDSLKTLSKIIYLIQKSILINEVIIQRKRDVKVSGDTTEFTAENYKLLENASAEDLLKLLPGIRVDKDGKITAYGEAVNKVYVDGEEFFGEDPTIATKNIKADMIEKVQVYDLKTDQEVITGVDDGEKNTVINLKLKDEFKKGFFGKVYSRVGLYKSLDHGAMFNAFKDKRKFSAYLTQSNIGNNSLGWKDRNDYGTSNDNSWYEEGASYSYSSTSEDDEILNRNDGISHSMNGGTNYNNKFLEDFKLNLNSSYSFSSGNRDIINTIHTEQKVNDSTYFKNERENYKGTLVSHKPMVRLVYDLDSNNKISYTINATIKSIRLNGDYCSETFNGSNDSLNTSLRSLDQAESSSSYNQSVLLSHQFKAIGRTLSLSANLNLNNNNKLKYINTGQRYFSEGLYARMATLNQKNDHSLYNRLVSLKSSFTESLGKKWLLEVHYKPTFATNKSTITSMVADITGEYSQKVDTLSNNFIFNNNRHELGFSIRYTAKALNASIILNNEINEQQRIDLVNSANNSKRANNAINPSLQLRYVFKNRTNLNFRYNGINTMPQIDQLQPIKDYSNPLSVNTGNPYLRSSYEHRMNLFLHRYSVQHSKYFYVSAMYNIIENAFTSQSTFSNEGVTKYLIVNGDNTERLSLWARYGRNMVNDLLRLSFEYGLNSGQRNNILNEIKNRSKSVQNSTGIDITYAKEKSLNLSIGYKITYGTNTNIGSVTTQTSIMEHQIETSGKLNFLNHWTLEANYSFRKNSTPSTTAYAINMLTVSTVYKFIKNKAELGLIGYNLFNENNGYTRYQNASSITQSQHNILGRYIMLSFLYNFSNKGAIQKEDDDEY